MNASMWQWASNHPYLFVLVVYIVSHYTANALWRIFASFRRK